MCCWELDSKGLLVGTREGAREVKATRVVRANKRFIQGVSAWDDDLWLSRSGGLAADEEKNIEGVSTHVLTHVRVGVGKLGEWEAPEFVESLSYSPSSDNLWTCTEITDPNVIFCVRRADVSG